MTKCSSKSPTYVDWQRLRTRRLSLIYLVADDASGLLNAGKAEVEVAYEYIVVMVAGCNQSGLLLLACIVGLIV